VYLYVAHIVKTLYEIELVQEILVFWRQTTGRTNCKFCFIKHKIEKNKKVTYLRTYLLTPCSRVLPEKLAGFHLVKKFLAF